VDSCADRNLACSCAALSVEVSADSPASAVGAPSVEAGTPPCSRSALGTSPPGSRPGAAPPAPDPRAAPLEYRCAQSDRSSLVADRVVGGRHPFFHVTQDRRQVVLSAQAPMG